ncbi:MAG: GNAT family N-acetyltransferase [Taibaiella sp.]|nr:GNAT family N-acetyltransferase [Taibaiella sp.]
MLDVQIRKVALADFDTIHRFVCGLEEEEFDKATLLPLFESCIEADNHIYLIAEIGGKAVGYISCHGQILLHHCGWVYEIQELFVLTEYRSQKIGASLVMAVENALNGKNCVSLEVASNRRREKAHAFYEALGYSRTSYKFTKDFSQNAK